MIDLDLSKYFRKSDRYKYFPIKKEMRKQDIFYMII